MKQYNRLPQEAVEVVEFPFFELSNTWLDIKNKNKQVNKQKQTNKIPKQHSLNSVLNSNNSIIQETNPFILQKRNSN